MKQKAILTECFTDETGKQILVVRHPNGQVLKVCMSLDEYNQFCNEFFHEPKNENKNE